MIDITGINSLRNPLDDMYIHKPKGVYNSKHVSMPSFTGDPNIFDVHFQNF